MEHKLYKREFSYQPRPYHDFKDGIHTHIEYFDFEHTEDLDDHFQEGGLGSYPFRTEPETTTRKKREWIYKEGDEHGLFIRYSNYGEIVLEEKTPLDGVWYSYHDNGKVNQEIPFKNGLKHGEEIWYGDNGNRIVLITWYEGYEHGLFIIWFDSGKELSREKWSKGELVEIEK